MMLAVLASCDKDHFADINQDPSKVTKADIGFLFTEALYQYDQTYTEWFYDNSKNIFPWAQVTASGGGNTGDMMYDGPHDNRWIALYSKMMPPLEDIRYTIDQRMTPVDGAKYQHIKAMTYLLQIAQAVKYTDVFGSMPYTEAGKARYTNPPLLTPKYDNQELLFNTWVKEIDNAIAVLSVNAPVVNGVPVTQISIGNQDFVYKSDRTKWLKYANGLKLRIAARLLNVDKARALALAEQVDASQYPNSNDDDFYYSPGTNYYHFGDGVGFGAGSKNLIDFLRDNQDPRLRFLFNKNEFNSIVVQGFFDAGKELPSYIAQNVEYTSTMVNGVEKKTFKAWKGLGEPWVRYYGAPAAPDAKKDPVIFKNYFNSENYKLGNKYFSKLSSYNAKNVITWLDFTYPDPSKTVEYKADAAYHACHMSAAEVNLYLAEFKLLGAKLKGTASDYYANAIRLSVNVHDKIARENDIAYYSTVYDPNEATVGLKNGEIDNLLAKNAYQLTGTTDQQLEKVYIQQYINLLSNPNELFVTARRSGYPKAGSTVLAREPFLEEGVELVVPRRFTVNNPTLDNINYTNAFNAIKEQGFTSGSNLPSVLNTERVWYDKSAPQWGAGK